MLFFVTMLFTQYRLHQPLDSWSVWTKLSAFGIKFLTNAKARHQAQRNHPKPHFPNIGLLSLGLLNQFYENLSSLNLKLGF